MFLMAIDPATTTGVCVGVPGERPRLYSHKFSLSRDDEPEAVFTRATFWMADYLRENHVDQLAIEAPFPSQNFATSMISLGLFGIFTGIAGCKSIPVMRVQISSWRKFFLGNGRLKGDAAKKQSVALCGRLGWEATDHNAAESAGIWSFAAAQIVPKQAPRPEPLFARVAQMERT